MKTLIPPNPHASAPTPVPPEPGISLWQRLKNTRVAFLTLPLLVMATLTEFVILATGWKYQQAVCLPQGMGVTFFGIGPIGATILAVELLKLPLAIWTASRTGWQKGFMLFAGLPLICVLTFQLVKDMAVYEMGTAMAPAGQLLEKAGAEEIKIAQLKGELTAIEQKKADRESKLAELAAKQAKAKIDLDEALKRNAETRQEAVTLTEYQKKELSDVEARQAAIIKQSDADAAQLTKTIAELRAAREVELGRATKWNAEEARIDNAHKAKVAEHANRKAAYEKDKVEYEAANFVKRQFLKEPVDPGVPPVRESNTILKPAQLAELDTQIKAKEDELAAVSTKRRDRVAQVDADARRVREEFDRRSSTKREETDRKRDDLLAALTVAAAEWKAEEKQVNEEFQAAAKKVDGIRAEIDASRKNAEGYYEAREASIRRTQVHRIATTVEIVRGLLLGERPMSITASAKERGDILTDQISMVRIWVYPVLAFIVAFLPTLMVEIGFSTLFKPPQVRPPHRLGFLGRNLHWLYIRAGRQKILRAERMAREVSTEISARDEALAAANAKAEQALAAKELELQAAREAVAAVAGQNDERSKQLAARHEAELKQKENEWVAKLAGMADSLNRTVVEKDALRDLQKSEIERQVQLRQHAWSDRLNQLRQDLDDQRAAAEADRLALTEEHHKRLLEVSEDCRTQVLQARRQIAAGELAAVESTAKLTHDLKEAVNARDAAVAQWQQQTEALSLKLSQAQEDAERALEKVARQEKHRWELQQLEFAKTLRQREEDAQHQLEQREQELALAFNARLAEEKHKVEQESRRREAELERQFETRAQEVDARWNQELKQREEAIQIRLKQREQQVQAQSEIRWNDLQSQTEQESRRQKLEFERKLAAQGREAEARLAEELQKQELAFHGRLKQREQELAGMVTAREIELQKQWASDLRNREEEWEKQAESRVRAAETRLGQDAQQQEEFFQMQFRQHEQELQAQFDTRQAELKAQWDQAMREREQEWERNSQTSAKAVESRWQAEAQQKEELFQSKLRQRDQQWQAKLDTARADAQAQSEQVFRRREAEAGAVLRELEARLRREMQQKDEAAQAEAAHREQELTAKLTTQAEERLLAAEEVWQKRWHSEAEEKVRATTSAFKVQLARAEKERDEARESAAAACREVEELEEQLKGVSSFLTGRKNGNHLVLAGR